MWLLQKWKRTVEFSEDIWVDALKGKLQQWLSDCDGTMLIYYHTEFLYLKVQ